MDASPPADLAALVVRWHNRHPLARRITPAQVQGEGLVLLPYRATRWTRGGLRRAFDEALVAPLRAAQVARFGRRAGSRERPGPPAWPQRQATVKPGVDPAGVTWRYLRTAAIELGQERRRVLIGCGPDGPVIGARLYSPLRLRVAAGALGGMVMAVALGLGVALGGLPGAATDPAGRGASAAAATATRASGVVQDTVAAAPAPASTAPAGTPPSAVRPTSAPTASPGRTTVALAQASAPTASSSLSPASAAASSAAPARGILPSLTEEARRQARAESQALRAAQAASAAAADPAAALANAQAGQVYAVATPSNRTRAGAQLRIVLMNAPTSAEPGRPRAEVLQVGNGFRAVIWPYTDRASAERTRELLSARGIPAEVIAF